MTVELGIETEMRLRDRDIGGRDGDRDTGTNERHRYRFILRIDWAQLWRFNFNKSGQKTGYHSEPLNSKRSSSKILICLGRAVCVALKAPAT